MFKVTCIIVAFFVLAVTWQVEALRCNCTAITCARVDERTCRHGVGLNACGCCQVCLRGPGERCGGPWNIEGKCGRNLTCSKLGPDSVNSRVPRRRFPLLAATNEIED
ncbi:venom protein 302 isoform X2 [Hyalella azteca]|uniref:Venom protein 302 isoform X2 n=1 Tax=Hyalella azteca TaxID=294128 RepID=A0A8B7N539_HYAAZ|nr:venom protein 302 isoform X2 [Hyalella azteca]